ncbi:hypothetical protein, partial [Mycobacterium sp. KBS0706]|uniref:hypothetical protein n=1 Tax=Mycobacterium sp. KBS0706 TaxID=2578109 RepID=UPI00163D8074
GIRPDPAWLDPDHSGAGGSHGRMAGEDGKQDDGEDDDEPVSPWWPQDGPEQCRYFYFKGSQKIPPGWIDLFTEKRLDRPPWELKPHRR